MRDTISFFILGDTGAPVRQVTLSKLFVRFLLVLAVAGVGAVGYGIHDYVALKQSVLDVAILQDQISGQHEVITSQRNQISAFAKKINRLKSKLIALNQFEKRIRVIANLEVNDEQSGLFGLGGPTPADLDTKISPQDPHNGLLREMHEQTDQLDLATARQEEAFTSLIGRLEDQVNLLASTPAIRPTKGWITCGFGYRKSPFTGLREFHKGIDIANRRGTPIIAAADGVVTFAGNKGMLGKTITINHGHGMVTRYGHAKELLKKKGEKVKRGETIARVGKTGRTTGSHVHYEVLLNGVPVNPKKYILN